MPEVGRVIEERSGVARRGVGRAAPAVPMEQRSKGERGWCSEGGDGGGGGCTREGWRRYGATSVGNRRGTKEMPKTEAADVKKVKGRCSQPRRGAGPPTPEGQASRRTDCTVATGGARAEAPCVQRSATLSRRVGEDGRSLARTAAQGRAPTMVKQTLPRNPASGPSTPTAGTVTRGGCGSPMTPRSRPPRLLAPPRPRWMDAHATRGGAHGTNLSPQLRGGVAAGGGSRGPCLSPNLLPLSPPRAHTRGGGVGVVGGGNGGREGGVGGGGGMMMTAKAPGQSAHGVWVCGCDGGGPIARNIREVANGPSSRWC